MQYTLVLCNSSCLMITLCICHVMYPCILPRCLYCCVNRCLSVCFSGCDDVPHMNRCEFIRALKVQGQLSGNQNIGVNCTSGNWKMRNQFAGLIEKLGTTLQGVLNPSWKVLDQFARVVNAGWKMDQFAVQKMTEQIAGVENAALKMIPCRRAKKQENENNARMEFHPSMFIRRQ